MSTLKALKAQQVYLIRLRNFHIALLCTPLLLLSSQESQFTSIQVERLRKRAISTASASSRLFPLSFIQQPMEQTLIGGHLRNEGKEETIGEMMVKCQRREKEEGKKSKGEPTATRCVMPSIKFISQL